MAKKPLYIPVAKGLDQSASERVASADVPLRLENCQFDRRGALVKRHGFAALSTTNDGGVRYPMDSARLLVSTGAELCLVTNQRLFAYDSALTQWVNRGPVSPACGRSETIFRDEQWYTSSDADESDSYVLYLAARMKKDNSDVFHSEVVSTVHAVGTTTTVPLASSTLDSGSFDPGGADSADYPHAVRVVGYSEGHYGLWLRGSSGASLEAARYLTGTPLVAPSYLSTVLAAGSVWVDYSKGGVNLGGSSRFTVRTYDAKLLADGGIVVAYIDDATRDLIVNRYDASLVLQDTTTITGGEADPWVRVALEPDPEAANNRFFLMAAREASGLHSVIAWSIRTTSLTILWGPTPLRQTGTLTEHHTNLGMCLATSLGVDYLACVWSWYDTTASWLENERYKGGTALTRALVDPDTGTATSDEWRYGLSARVKPWSVSERFYVGGHTTCTAGYFGVGVTWPEAVNDDTNLIDSHVIVELSDQQVASRFHLSGVYDVGTCPVTTMAYFDLGNCQTSYEVSSGVWRWLEHESETRGVQVSEIEMDYTRPPMAVRTTAGSVVIGGAHVSWYDGDRVVELGHVHPPMPHNVDNNHSYLGDYAVGDFAAYQAVWFAFDANGVLHRSLPTFRFEREVTVATNGTIAVSFKSIGATNRLDGPQYGIALFREEFPASTGSSGVPRRVNRTLSATPNVDALATDDVIDRGKPSSPVYDQIYTAGGELEVVCPEGAQIPAVVNGRLYLGGFFRRARVQYSKPFAPGTASEYAFAPEFNEGFGFVFDSGSTVTGVSFLDQDAVLFTADAIYLNAGEGPTDTGADNDFSGPKRISSDSGCIEPRSVVSTPAGVIYQSDAGIHLLDRGRQVVFIGEAVQDETDAYPVITSAVLVPDDQHVRITCTTADGTDGVILVFDYTMNQWVKWTPQTAEGTPLVAVSACVHDGDYYVVESSGAVWKLDESLYEDGTRVDIHMVVETAWIQAAKHGGWQRVQNVTAMCRRLGAAGITLEVETDFDDAGGSSQSHTWADADLQTFPRFPDTPVTMKLIDQKSHAVKVRLKESGTTQGIELTGFRFDLVQKRGAAKVAKEQRA